MTSYRDGWALQLGTLSREVSRCLGLGHTAFSSSGSVDRLFRPHHNPVKKQILQISHFTDEDTGSEEGTQQSNLPKVKSNLLQII